MSLPRLLAASACLAAACAPSDSSVTLADLPDLRVVGSLVKLSGSEPASYELYMHLEYDVLAFMGDHGECATLGDSLTATWDGVPVFADRGAPSYQAGTPCYLPLINARRAGAWPGELRVSGDSGAVVAAFDTVEAARHVALAAGQPGWFGAGDVITIDDRRAGEQDREDAIWLPLADASGSIETYARTYRHRGGRVEVQIPDPVPFAGPGILDFGSGTGTAAVRECTGAEACELRMAADFQVGITLAP
jgi:hypothetical protein